MVNIKEALNLLNVNNDYIFSITFYDNTEYGRWGLNFTLKEIKEKLNMSKIFVRKINYSCDRYDGEFLGWDFWVCDENGKNLDIYAMYKFVHRKTFKNL